jgi:hydroxyacylglutathione hydrolase
MKEIDAGHFELVTDANDALILDTRDSATFAKGFIPQAINIGTNGDFAPWVGAMIGDVKQAIILVTELGKEDETVTRLTRVGFDNIVGHLKGGFDTWKSAGNEIDTVDRITANIFATKVKIGEDKIIDIRKQTEYGAEHVEDSYSRPLAEINEWVKDINPDEHFYMHCQSGYRSMIAASILQSRGYRNFTEVAGGFKAIVETTIPKTDFVCQSKLSTAN